MNWMQTFTAKIVDIENPTPEMVNIQDIAHALSMTCRFGGHCRDFYSVAEHSLLVEAEGIMAATEMDQSKPGHVQILDYDRLSLILLLHDAAEAYTGDLTTPVKHTLDGFSGGKAPVTELEDRWLLAIGNAFGLGESLRDEVSSPLVKEADKRALAIEVVNLFNPVRPEWKTVFKRSESGLIQCYSPAEAKRHFLNRFWYLTGGQQGRKERS